MFPFGVGDPIVEDFIRRVAAEEYDIDYTHPSVKRLTEALSLYDLDKTLPLAGSIMGAASSTLNAIARAKLSGAIKPRGVGPGESLKKKQDKSKNTSLENIMQEFIKWVQEHPQPIGEPADNNKGHAEKNGATGTKETAIAYDKGVKQVEEAKNAPLEKKKSAKQLLDFLKDNRPYLVALAIEFLRKYLSST